jgi:hypothetical protein
MPHNYFSCLTCRGFARVEPEAHCSRCDCTRCKPPNPETCFGDTLFNGITPLAPADQADMLLLRTQERRMKLWQAPPLESCPIPVSDDFDFGLLPPGVNQAGHMWPKYRKGMFTPFLTAMQAEDFSVSHTHTHTPHTNHMCSLATSR